jgi:excinuclease ABC subunit C
VVTEVKRSEDNPVNRQVARLPARPGVYLMKDAGGNILYVGKASSLRHRVRSYFQNSRGLTPKVRTLVSRIRDLDFFITASEQEALILELNLIKRHYPPFNVALKDDKAFPYLKIDLREEWPRVQITRRLEDDGARYFGPFANARSIRPTLKTLRRLFPFRSCAQPDKAGRKRACLEYHVGNCPAPCIGAITKKEYHRTIRNIVRFLEGKQQHILRQLEADMQIASAAMEFERAAVLRDRLAAARDIIEAQQIAIRLRGECDVIALAGEGDLTCVQVFFIRGGKLIGRESFTLKNTRDEASARIITSFVEQFYAASPHVPPLLLVQYPLEEPAVIEAWLRDRRGSRVKISVPQRGARKQLVEIVAENARQGLEQLKIKGAATGNEVETALNELKEQLNLDAAPARIEGYDISNIQGTAAVGSMVVFENGRPRPAAYRRFRIKTITGADDYGMLKEVLSRRFKRGAGAGDSWASLPDLLLIDGGKGQLNAVLSALAEVQAPDIPAIGLAKENEEIYLPGRSRPLVLSRRSAGLQLLQRVRDEAHRFALAYFQRTRRRQTFISKLDGISGIGPKRKRALLQRFGSLKGIRAATVEELAATEGINTELAKDIKDNI